MKNSGRVNWFFSILASNLVRCVLRVAASLLRTFSHYVHHVHKPRVFAFLWSYTLALGSCLIASKDKAITKATTSGSVITEPTTQASASSASSASLRPFFALLAITCICNWVGTFFCLLHTNRIGKILVLQ